MGSIATGAGASDWYVALEKPFFTPPSWLFMPVWIALYTCMGIAAFLVWRVAAGKRSGRFAMILFAIQLVLNGLWSFIFFGLRSPFWASVEMLLLIGFITLTMDSFRGISKAAYILMWPYLVWVLFAAALNLWILFLNV